MSSPALLCATVAAGILGLRIAVAADLRLLRLLVEAVLVVRIVASRGLRHGGGLRGVLLPSPHAPLHAPLPPLGVEGVDDLDLAVPLAVVVGELLEPGESAVYLHQLRSGLLLLFLAHPALHLLLQPAPVLILLILTDVLAGAHSRARVFSLDSHSSLQFDLPVSRAAAISTVPVAAAVLAVARGGFGPVAVLLVDFV